MLSPVGSGCSRTILVDSTVLMIDDIATLLWVRILSVKLALLLLSGLPYIIIIRVLVVKHDLLDSLQLSRLSVVEYAHLLPFLFLDESAIFFLCSGQLLLIRLHDPIFFFYLLQSDQSQQSQLVVFSILSTLLLHPLLFHLFMHPLRDQCDLLLNCVAQLA